MTKEKPAPCRDLRSPAPRHARDRRRNACQDEHENVGCPGKYRHSVLWRRVSSRARYPLAGPAGLLRQPKLSRAHRPLSSALCLVTFWRSFQTTLNDPLVPCDRFHSYAFPLHKILGLSSERRAGGRAEVSQHDVADFTSILGRNVADR